MLGHILAVVPVGLVLGLLVFGRYGGRENPPTRGSILLVGVGAILAGPVAMKVLGLAGWLMLVTSAAAALTAYAASRSGPRRPAAPQG